MFVIERGGMPWSKRFYVGKGIFDESLWGSIDYAYKFPRQSEANSMSHRIDDEDGYYTTVESADTFLD
jgi:hypothetical protein